jgi:hypothetical protein
MSRLVDLEELSTEEYDSEYTEEFKNDLPGAKCLPTS